MQKMQVLSLGQDNPRRKQQPTPVFLSVKFYGQRRLVGYSLWGHKESDTTEELNTHKSLSSSDKCCVEQLSRISVIGRNRGQESPLDLILSSIHSTNVNWASSTTKVGATVVKLDKLSFYSTTEEIQAKKNLKSKEKGDGVLGKLKF